MATPFVGIALRKVGWIVGGVVGLIWFLTYRNSMNAEIADLQMRLQRSMASSEALATQLQVINNHKDKINQMIETKEASFAKETEELNRKASELQSQQVLLTNELKECQSRVSNLSVQLEEKEEAGRKVVDVVALRPAGDGRIDSVKQRIDNNFQQAVKPNVLPQQPAADETRESGAAKEEAKNLFPPPVQSQQLPVLPDHGYVNGNSVHFHRQESANKALEFQRDGGGAPAKPPVNVNNDGDNNVGDAENGAEKSDRQVVKPQLDVAAESIHKNENADVAVAAAPKRINKKKRRRNKDGRENDEDEEIVVDFRQNDLPDKEKMVDYKEMPQ